MDTLDKIDPSNRNNEPDGPRRHPEANTSLFLGIVSIALSTGPLGIAMALFGIIASLKTMKAYKKNTSLYTPNSYTRARAGLICSIAALFIFGITSLIYVLIS